MTTWSSKWPTNKFGITIKAFLTHKSNKTWLIDQQKVFYYYLQLKIGLKLTNFLYTQHDASWSNVYKFDPSWSYMPLPPPNRRRFGPSLSKGKFDALKQLKRDDWKFERNYVLIYYKWSKTNQNASKVTWVHILSYSLLKSKENV